MGLSPAHFIAPAVALAIGWVVALGSLLTAEIPEGFVDRELVPFAALLAALAATVALLVSWGELDLSAMGTVALTGHIYAEYSDAAGVFGGIVLGAAAGVGIGAVIGVLRWLTRVQSGYLSLAGGMLLYSGVLRLAGPGGRRILDGAIEAWEPQVMTGLVFVAAAAVLGAVLVPRDSSTAGAKDGPGPQVIIGFALSGAAAGVVGAVFAGWRGISVAGLSWTFWLLPIFAAVAIGGVLRGSKFLGPLGAALGAIATTMILDADTFHGWEIGSGELLLAAVLTVCLVVSYGLHRAFESVSG